MNTSALTGAALAASFFLAAAPSAMAFDTPTVSARLLVAGGLADGAYRAALDLELPEGWHTYWVNPGDAGIPPLFDVAKSVNLKDFAVSYPAPVRYFDGTSTSMIYQGHLVLPIRAVPVKPGAPVELSVRVFYGLCDEVCLPVESDVSVHLEPGAAADAGSVAAIEAAETALPVRVDDDRLTVDDVQLDPATGKGSLSVSVVDDGRPADLFARGPSRWFIAPPQPTGSADGRRQFAVAIEGPAGAKDVSGLELGFVLTGGDRPYEIVRRLDDSHR